MSRTTSDPTDPQLTRGVDKAPTDQAPVYLVLSEAERAKGFIRPVRNSYIHRGIRPKFTTRPLNEEEKQRYDGEYALYEAYPAEQLPVTGRFWTAEQLKSGCGSVTTMALDLAETYARRPEFYGSTYCVNCRKHLPVEEFVWEQDGEVVGS